MVTKTTRQLGAEKALSLVSDQWFILIVHALMGGKQRYAELQRAIPNVSKKMLTQTLRRMERDGLVCRTVFPVVPPHTEYELTELGKTLVPPLQALCRWGKENYATVEQNRAAFDQRTYSADAGSSPA
jgi:DNA-binding HxlR family transcriptional regulator